MSTCFNFKGVFRYTTILKLPEAEICRGSKQLMSRIYETLGILAGQQVAGESSLKD